MRRFHVSDRSRGVLVIAGLSAAVLVATAAVAQLAMPRRSGDGRPDPQVGRPVAGVHAPILVPIIEVPPPHASPTPKDGSEERETKKEKRKGEKTMGKPGGKAVGKGRVKAKVKDVAGKAKDTTDKAKGMVDGADLPKVPSP